MRYAIFNFCLFILLATNVTASTYLVSPDGTGDFPTIQAAINAVVDGDVIELTNGTFTGDGNRDIDYFGKTITVRSQSGDPEACIIDCEGSPGNQHRGFSFISDEGPESVLEGVTITNGYLEWPEWGGGVQCMGSDPTLINCIISNNTAPEGGGLDNTSASDPTLIGCIFHGNAATAGGGMASSSASFPTLNSCTFYDNYATAFGGGAAFVWSIATLTNCTFYANASPQGSGIHSGYGSLLTLENCLFTFSTQGEGVGCGSDVAPTLTCCDVFGNANGDWVGCISDQFGVNGNISEDPLYCDPENWDFQLQENSPCAPYSPPNIECYLIGAWPIGCGPVSASQNTWGGLKVLYR